MNICGLEFSERLKSTDNNELPSGSFVYLIFLGEEIVYVGQTSRLSDRICAHKCTTMKGCDFEFSYSETRNRRFFERVIINKIKPEINKDHKHVSSSSLAGVIINSTSGNYGSIDYASKRTEISLDKIMDFCIGDASLSKSEFVYLSLVFNGSMSDINKFEN